MPTLLRQPIAGLPLAVHGNGQQTRSRCSVADLLTGLLAPLVADISAGTPRAGANVAGRAP